MGGRPQEYRKYAAVKRPAAKRRPAHFLLLLAVFCVLLLIVRSRVFVVREIDVTGNSVRQDAEIAGRSGLYLGMNIFSVDEELVSRNLSADNYVELIGIDIEMPDSVTIHVRERVPCAALNCAGVVVLVDEEGYILERRTGIPEGSEVIVVSGMNISVGAQSRMIESGTAGQLTVMRKLLAAIRTSGMHGLVSELNVEDQDNLYLVSKTGIQVLLGDEEQLEQKLTWMRAVLEELTKNGVMSGVLDVSSGKNAVYADR